MQIQFNLTFIRPWSLLSSKFFHAHSLQFLLASIPLDPDSLDYFPISQNFKQNLPILYLWKHSSERKTKYSQNKGTKDSNLMKSFFFFIE